MSDTSQGPGWWLASDGKWYPPELWTGPPGAGPAPAGAPSSAPPNPTAPPAQGYGGAPPYPSATGGPYQPSGYGPPPGMPPYAPGAYGQGVYAGGVRAQKTNGLAVASLVCSCVGLFFLPMVLGIIFGFVARSQIRRSNGAQRGDGLAIAGIIVGFAWAAFFVVTIIVSAVNSNTSSVVVPALAGLIS